jgi:hypothetical protein
MRDRKLQRAKSKRQMGDGKKWLNLDFRIQRNGS